MSVGINKKELSIINSIFKMYNQDYTFYFYGSRIKGGFNSTSDLDVLIKGNSKMPIQVLSSLKDDFDASMLPYIVNFCDYFDITESFYNLIKNDLVDATKYKVE